MVISKLTSEDFLDKSKPANTFNRLFFYTVSQAILVYSIAIPFFLQDYTSLDCWNINWFNVASDKLDN